VVPGVARAALFLGAPDRGPYAVVAVLPGNEAPTAALRDAAERAMSERSAVVGDVEDEAPAEGPGARPDVLAVPILSDGRLLGGVSVELPHRPKAQRRAALQLLQWGAGWIDLALRDERAAHRERLAAVLGIVATALEHGRFQSSATAVATHLATRLGLERVAIGFLEGGHHEVRALSHSARFDRRAALVRAIEAAMDEAGDQDATLVHPAPPGAPPRVSRAHEALVADHGAGAAFSVPLVDAGRIVGALNGQVPSGAALLPESVKLCEHVATLLGPILELRRRDDRWLVEKIADVARAELRRLLGPEHAARKALVGGLSALLLVLAVLGADYRIAADATLEGTVQRVVAAATDGFVAEAPARAGDVVQAGDLLAALDDRDLRLERLKWAGQRNQTLQQYREALATHERAQVSVLSAQLAQADAQLELLDEQISRTRLVAPFEGIVVTGDLSQALGSPVTRGQVLFEVAPLDAFRVILEVDERDIAEVEQGQRGQLALSSMPGRRLPFAVQRITPVSSAEEGRNHFRVEAHLDERPEFLRPGMEGVAKIEVGRRSLLWIWTHGLIDRLRLWLWTWTP
jgi:RND family efflux transporter MFP subunit